MEPSATPFPSKIRRTDVERLFGDEISPKCAPSKKTSTSKRRMARKWRQHGFRRRDDGIISPSKTGPTKRHNFRKPDEARRACEEGTEGIVNLKLSGFFSIMRSIAWSW